MGVSRVFQAVFLALFLGGYAALAIVLFWRALCDLMSDALQEWRRRETRGIERGKAVRA